MFCSPGHFPGVVTDTFRSDVSVEYFQPDGTCVPETWPDKDNDLVCGDCSVLVGNNFGSVYETCEGYCNSIGAKCTGAWEEKADSCVPAYGIACDRRLASTDAICECSREYVLLPRLFTRLRM